MAGGAKRPKTVDEYLAGVGDDKRAALEKLRKTIRAAAPRAEECISYGLAAFRLGRPLVGFGATEKHCALYLMSGSTVETHRAALEGFDTSKGTIRFLPNEPLPAALVRKLVKARVAEIAAAGGAAPKRVEQPARGGTSNRGGTSKRRGLAKRRGTVKRGATAT